MVAVVAWNKLLKIEAVAVFDGVTSVVGFAFIDIWRKKIQVAFSKSTELRAELRVSPGEGPLFFEGASGQFPK